MPIVLILLSFWLILYVARRIYYYAWHKNLFVTIAFSDAYAYEKDTSHITEVITNKKRLPLAALHVKFQSSRYLNFAGTENNVVSDQNYKNDLYAVMGWQQIKRTLTFTCDKRGVYHIDHADLTYSWLWFDMLYTRRLDQDTTLTVLPGRLPAEWYTPAAAPLFAAALSKQRLYSDPFAFAGLRDYTSSDSFKSVNAKASAKTGRLLVNTYEPYSASKICLIVNLEPLKASWAEERMEDCIRIAFSLAGQLVRSGAEVALVTSYHTFTGQKNSIFFGRDDRFMLTLGKELAALDLSLPAPSLDHMTSALLPCLSLDTVCALISPDTAPESAAAADALAHTLSGLFLYRPCRYGDEFQPHSPLVKVIPLEFI